MCWSQQLFDAMIHVYNRGLTDYTTPLLELLLQLRATLKKGKPLPGLHLTSPMSVNIRECAFAYSSMKSFHGKVRDTNVEKLCDVFIV